MKRKILIKNRRNHNECLELTLEEFKAKFENELKTAINTYKVQEEHKNFLPPFVKTTPNYEQDFLPRLALEFQQLCSNAILYCSITMCLNDTKHSLMT